MPAVTSLACRLAVASLAALGLIGPAAWAAERYEPRVLFSVRYGGADGVRFRPAPRGRRRRSRTGLSVRHSRARGSQGGG